MLVTLRGYRVNPITHKVNVVQTFDSADEILWCEFRCNYPLKLTAIYIMHCKPWYRMSCQLMYFVLGKKSFPQSVSKTQTLRPKTLKN